MTLSPLPAPRQPDPDPRRVLRLRHGVAVTVRPDGLVVVGQDPEHRVVLPDTASVTRLLTHLRVGVRPDNVAPTASAALDALCRAGLLVDLAQQSLLAEARATTRVQLEVAQAWRGLAVDCVRTAGLTLAEGSRPRDGHDLVWVVSAGDPDWEVHDTLVAADEPVLFTAVMPSRVRVGPFVMPGTTACLRCLDAHSPGVRPPSGGGTPDDVSLVVLHRALLSAAGDLRAWAEGRQPTSWSATAWVDDSAVTTREAWRQHPHCGCNWHRSMTG